VSERSQTQTRERSRPPAPGSIRPFEFPEVSSAELDNGLDLRVARLHRLPVVSVSLVLNAGESWLGRDRAGLAVLTGDALEGGTEERSGPELAEALERIGASLSVSTGWDSTTVGLRCHADRLEDALPLLAETVLGPAFPEDEFDRIRAQQLASLEERRKKPGKMATDAALATIFPEDVPYARPTAGTLESVGGLEPDDARSFAAEAFRPGDGGLVVAGDVDSAEVEAMAREHLGDWSGAARGRPEFDPRRADARRRVVLVHRPESVQSEIRIGQVGIRKTSDDYFPLLLFNTILGGTFTSRLNQSLREEHGYTYGVRSRFSARRQPGPFTISTAVETEVTAPAVEEALRQIEGLVEEGPTGEELEGARDYVAGVFPLRFETTGQIASRVAQLIVYGLADDYYDTYRDRIRAVERDELHEAARRLIRPEELAVVIAGDAERIREPMEALELGPLEVVEPG